MDSNYVRLPLTGAYNVRDLGGYPCEAGCTAWRAFLRADDLGRLTMSDIGFLKEYGLAAVVDLRGAAEARAVPDPFAADETVAYLHMPLMNEEATASPDLSKTVRDVADDYLPKAYIGMLSESKPAVKRIFSFIAAQRPGCILYHCAAGKDRTGVLSALLLGLCGVCDADILANYSVTYTYLRANAELMKASSGYPKGVMYSLPEYLEPSLAVIHGQYGGFEAYLLSAGLDARTIRQVRERLAGR